MSIAHRAMSLSYIELKASGKPRVSPRRFRACVFCKWRADLWDQFLAGFDARASFIDVPGKTWEYDEHLTRINIFEILPDFSKILPDFQNFA